MKYEQYSNKKLVYSLGADLCIRLEQERIMAVSIPTNESEWDINMALRKHFEQKMGMDLYVAVEKDSFRPE